MNSQGIGGDIRRLLLRGNVFALAIAVLVGTALFQLLLSIVEYLAIPFARGILDKSAEPGEGFRQGFYNEPMYLRFNGYSLAWGIVLSVALTLALATLLVLFLKRRLAFDDEDEDEPEFEEESDFRACPECLSLIPAAARRCAYCTAPVAPSAPEPQE
jgi:large conductance mechanosensitive channel